MAPKSRLEIDFIRLLHKCETFVTARDLDDWRLEKYIDALEEKLNQVKHLNFSQTSKDELNEYSKKVKFLKGVVDAERRVTSSEKLMATQLLSPVTSALSTRNDAGKTKEIHLLTQSKYGKQVRDELFDVNSSGSGIRQRITKSDEKLSSDDVDAVLKYHHNVQEKIAEEMVSLARNLKENCHTAGRILKNDQESLNKISQAADSNYEKLKTNSDKLGEFVRRSCQYWLWIMLAVVSMTFLWIVVFIRLFPKGYR